jgi:hypothetical protein
MKLKILVMLYEYLYWYVQLPLLSPVDNICFLLEYMQFIFQILVIYIVKNILDWELYF